MIVVNGWVNSISYVNDESKIINNWSASEWKVGTGLDIVGGGVFIITGKKVSFIRSAMFFIYQAAVRRQEMIKGYFDVYLEIDNTDRLRYELSDKRDDFNV